MSSASLASPAVQLRAGASRAARRTGWAVAVGSAVALTATLALCAVIASRGGAGGWPSVGHLLVRGLSGAAMAPVGALMIAVLPRSPIGQILCIAGLGKLVATAGQAYATADATGLALPLATWAGWVGEWAGSGILLVPGVALVLFPDGHLLRPGWRWSVRAAQLGVVLITLGGVFGAPEDLSASANPFVDASLARGIADLTSIGWLLLIPGPIVGLVSLRIRLVQSTDGPVRLQLVILRRVAVAVVASFGLCFVTALAGVDVGSYAAVLSLAVLAAGMGLAILGHGMLGLDAHVDRGLAALATAFVLGAVYVACVLGVNTLLPEPLPLGAALPATVLVALALAPVHRVLLRQVRRLLHGRGDDPFGVIRSLGHRIDDVAAPSEVLGVLVQSIAEELRVPYVAITLDDQPGLVAAEHGVAAAGLALQLPMTHAGKQVGVLAVGARGHGQRLSPDDRRIMEYLARRAGTTAHAVALSLELQRSRERIVSAREEERRRLRADLHDGLGPSLAGAALLVEAAQRQLVTDPAAADALLGRAADAISGTVAEVRRVVYGLRPPVLDELGLSEALRQEGARWATGAEGLAVEVVTPPALRMIGAAAEAAIYRIAQEALTNIARHARATHAHVRLDTEPGHLRLRVTDDGDGLPVDLVAGVGLASMRERAAETGGRCTIHRGDGGGTVVEARIPLTSP